MVESTDVYCDAVRRTSNLPLLNVVQNSWQNSQGNAVTEMV